MGIRCSNKRVARLMREQGLRARVSRLYRRSTGVHRFFEKTSNLRLDQPVPTRTDQIGVGDLTYLRLGKHWRYLATVMDLFSRRIIGWTLARNRTTDVTLRALKRAIALRGPRPGLLFHSDRGIEYSAYGYQDFLRSRGIVPSMNRPRNCQDNAHMESFFHSLKAELTHQRSFTSDAELNASVAAYIDRFYNEKLIHSSWDIIHRSSSNAWPMPSKVSTKSDEDQGPERRTISHHRAGPPHSTTLDRSQKWQRCSCESR